ncbi:MAG TPA: DUF192 domain-containing protein [Steroidobacteraceae bacterium]|nr:DUF192 domain-containing protein [Steroidobacteraceae bacterium]
MIRRFAIALPAASLILLASAWVAHAQNEPLEPLSSFPRTDLTLKGGNAAHHLSVWVADTPARRTQGLMYVRELPPDQGMLFLQCCTGIWMKNTYIELDILFIAADGRITKIAHGRPFDLSTIPSDGPADAVVELAGGTAAHLGLKAGDRAQWVRSPPAPGAAAPAKPRPGA